VHSAIGALILVSAARNGVGGFTIARMTFTLVTGAAVGSIPFVGGATGAAYRGAQHGWGVRGEGGVAAPGR
jgi:hypothetical protein